MTRFLALCLTLTSPAALLAEDIPLTSRLASATLYPSGATLTRDVVFEAPAGEHQLILTDLPPGTPLESVRVKVEGATMGSVTTRRDFTPPRHTDDAALQAAEAKVEAAEAALRAGLGKVQMIRLESEAAQARVQFLAGLGKSEAIAGLGVDGLRQLSGMIGEETLLALQAARDASDRADAAERDLKDLRQALEDARQELQALVPEVENRAMLAVAIRADAPVQGRVEVTYTIPDAGWLPVYDARLTRETSQLILERGAFVHQATGENWDDIALTLSTVRPSEQTEPGQVWPWPRRIYDPKQFAKTMARAEAEADMFAGAAAPAPMEEPMMIEQAAASFDGLSVTYDYPGLVSVATGVDRVRLALGTLSTDVALSARAVPLSDETAFLMATLTNDTGELILPTSEAMLYLDGRFVGRRHIGLIAAGDEAELSFGPIDGLRLTRTVLDRNEGDRGILSKSNALSEEVRIEVQNLTGESWPVELRDHVPYSEQDDLLIRWSATPKPDEETVEDKRGVLAWRFDLPAGDTKTVSLSHTIEWPDGMELQ